MSTTLIHKNTAMTTTIPPLENDVFKSAVFPGLWLDAEAMLRGDLKSVLATLATGIASQEHADFVKQLTTDD